MDHKLAICNGKGSQSCVKDVQESLYPCGTKIHQQPLETYISPRVLIHTHQMAWISSKEKMNNACATTLSNFTLGLIQQTADFHVWWFSFWTAEAETTSQITSHRFIFSFSSSSFTWSSSLARYSGMLYVGAFRTPMLWYNKTKLH